MSKTGEWRRALLRALGAPASPGNLRFLANWQRWEGGHTNNDARFNWLNTTHDAPGAVGSINDVGVKKFRSFDDGVFATAATLMNGRYDDVVQALKSGTPYRHDVSAGLQTWVSGSPTGNPGYAAKVLGRRAPSVARRGPTRADLGREYARRAEPEFDIEPLKIAFSEDPEFVSLLASFQDQPEFDVRRNQPKRETEEPQYPRGSGTAVRIPQSWKGTHVTDGLGWGTKTAADIMGNPGSPVTLPEDVTVLYYHPTGAQGGGSMLVRTQSGREYWLGHVTNGAQAGTRVRAGQPLAVISPDHPRPHVHVDRRG